MFPLDLDVNKAMVKHRQERTINAAIWPSQDVEGSARGRIHLQDMAFAADPHRILYPHLW